ncbi:YbaY family lipoprotein [Luteimonas sp. RD2P54]|uniref:YbaY family lipoprotein n=1 Tax=Luteimonas endophytica TaxID=3042023 RepID=A0ABT6J8U0_9GAMM|nr:YbaY family lipoprotein [Luteimonas endophytica]MDH5823242.1 YbaY family lipoprotein [Luteimonas endophytica]
MPARPAALACCLLLAGCQSPTAADAATGAAIAAERAMIHGRATYYEKLLMPPDSVLHVRLVEPDAAAGAPAIAEARFTPLSGPPYEFSLPFDATRLREGASYGLTATLTTPHGERFFTTERPVPVQPHSGEVVDFRMLRTDVP